MRLHVDFYGKYNDWVCKCYNGGCELTKSTNIIKLYSLAKGIEYREAKKYINNDVYDSDKLKNKIKKKKEYKSPTNDINTSDIDMSFGVIKRSKYWLSRNDANKCRNDRFKKRYIKELLKFRIDRCIPKEYELYVAYDGDYKNRIIIPIIIDNEIRYFQGRSIFDHITPKYDNPEIDKSGIILNSDKFNRKKSIIITEGIIDAFMVEDNQGTACLGSYFSDEFIKKIISYTDGNVIICFDNPFIDKAGYEEMKRFIKESKYKHIVRYFIPDSTKFKDLNELKIQNPKINIYNYVLLNSYQEYAALAKIKINHKYS